MEGIQTTSQLKKELGINGSTISHSISNLEKNNITTKDGEKYILTPIGHMIVCNLLENIRTTAAIIKFQKLWFDHDISAIPPRLINRLGDLYHSTLIESDVGEIFKPYEIYQELLLKSKYIKGVSSIFRFNYIELFQYLIVNHDIDVELILTKNIIQKIIEDLDPNDLKQLKDSMKEGKVKLRVIDQEVKIAFTVTDKYLSLGLFHETGGYDNTKEIISDDHDAVAWAITLFEYYRNQSEKVQL